MGKKYSPNFHNHDIVRDKAYPSEIAAQRPMLAPRIHCADDYYDRHSGHTLRGDLPEQPSQEMTLEEGRLESMCERFNHSLRAGVAFRSEGDE